jgi:hypothetical protein
MNCLYGLETLTENYAWIGIVTALVSASISALGVNLQALGLEAKRELTLSPLISAHEENFQVFPSEYENTLPANTDSITIETHREIDNLETNEATSLLSPVPVSNTTLTIQTTGSQELLLNASEIESNERIEKKNYKHLVIWWTGFILYMTCEMFGSLIALAFISPMLLAPLGSMGPIFNIFFSKYLLKNVSIGSLDYIGTLLIVGGCAAVSWFGAKLPDGGRQSCCFLIEKK